jgi:citrate lyase subunit beta/citryl-CoA lyase
VDTVAWAQEVLRAGRKSTGVTTVRRRMVDEPILRHARALVEAAQNSSEGHIA